MGIAPSKSSPEHGLFTCFKRLPAELRLEIWEQSLPPRNMMLNVQPHPEGVRRVIRSDDWHGGLPAHLFTCWEARHVALARCPWKYNKIDILYLAGRMNAYFRADGTWGPYAGRERILAVDDGCPFWYKTKKYERFRPHEGHPRVTRSRPDRDAERRARAGFVRRRHAEMQGAGMAFREFGFGHTCATRSAIEAGPRLVSTNKTRR
ncbi:hypothetical protein EKO27_g10304 [Xylaria grammica]|uniref:2EXR domain-containing protein n=1 Tax=Xylaria grammica TaxID=363999 RepID=A0A439CRN2_9PEZI|nr:hypothetical protein EKO27_g10304 [Xylaria grammica]